MTIYAHDNTSEPQPPSIQPPERFSDLVLMAIADGRALDPQVYYPDFTRWHDSPMWATEDDEDPLCQVCLAGAVIAGTLSFPRHVGFHLGTVRP